MEKLPDEKTASSIASVMRAIEIRADDESVGQIAVYAEDLIRWGRRVNLTGASTVQDLVERPLFDALTLVPVLEPRGALVDVGSGGGLPGIPAAVLMPDLKLTLVEPRARKTSFLRHVIHLLGLDAEVVQARREELKDGLWRGAVAQAVWPVQKWLERAVKLVEPGGAIYALSSEPIDPLSAPNGTSIEVEKRFVRPCDHARRYSVRLRRSRVKS